MALDKIEALLALIAETVILILTNQLGQAGLMTETKPMIESLRNNVKEIMND